MSDTGVLVHIVDDDEAIRQSLAFMLSKAGYSVETYPSGTEFLKHVTRETRGCVLLDLRMPDIDGLEVQARLSKRGIMIPVIMLTGHGDVTLAVRAMKAGAIEFLEKPFERTALLEAVQEAMDQTGRTERYEQVSAAAIVRLKVLTLRERDVLELIAIGRPNKLIAFDLGIATRTVEVHRANIMEKLSARNISDVLRLAFIAGFGQSALI